MKHQTSTDLYAYWMSAHTDDAVRARGISAAELAPLLPDLFLIDLTPPDDARFRFCGAAIATRYGRDLTDESFTALWGPLDRATLQRDFPLMSTQANGLVAGVMGETMGGGMIAYEMLLLPLVGASGGRGAIGSMVRLGGHDERNRIRGRLVAQSLRSVRFLPAATPADRSRPATLGAWQYDPSLRPRRYGHLTVVNGGR